MPELSVDFGLFIAYLIPGFIASLGISFVLAPVANLLSASARGEDLAGSIFGSVCLIVVVGMTISIWRAGLIDSSFTVDIPVFCDVRQDPQACGIHRADPVYSSLASKDRLEAYLVAEKNDKRPYQFYGNTLIAVVIFTAGWLLSDHGRQVSMRNRIAALALALLLVVTLYSAARLSHYRYTVSVLQFNALKGPAP
ncbi:hypothetical protein [Paraburkholderia flagellata]|uniref:hypothetical protein n=1 Tax=Paraburkholderia flagellata TaxID=2883241 RepID=UPI001F385875|nr:hypothetical protein [Paraburkholderia flagellata]